MKKALGFVFFFVLPILALAQAVAPPASVDAASGFLPQLIAAAVSGNWNIAGGIILMVLMVAVRQYALPKLNVSSDILPVVSAIIGALAMVGLSMSAGGSALDAAKNGVTMAIFAGGSWSLIGKFAAKAILGSAYQDPDAAPKA